MGDNKLNIGSTASSDILNATGRTTNVSESDEVVAYLNTDGISDQKETTWINSNWSKYWGLFNEIADLKSAILMKCIWNVGKGWTADPETQVILEHITGWGKDTFDDIIFNMEVIKRVGGDSYAEIIRDPDTDLIINLKPLDPGSIRIVVGSKGTIIRYEQINKLGGKGITQHTFKPEEILHLSNNRLADQIHGISDIESLEKTILAENQNFEDINWIMKHQAKPLIVFKLGTDDTAKIAAFTAKMDSALAKGENIYVPDDLNSFQYEVVQVNPSQMIMEWRNDIRNKFYRNIGLPQIVPGAGGNSTESESKVIYLAFEQLVEKDQRYLELQLYNQLNIKVNFIPPATLSAELQQDQSKDGSMMPQPSDTQAGVGR
jgi:hypothetical protein